MIKRDKDNRSTLRMCIYKTLGEEVLKGINHLYVFVYPCVYSIKFR